MYYGFDIGGTKIALGVFDANRCLQWEKRIATPRSSYDDFLQAIAALVHEADARFGVKGSVGIGIPGMPPCSGATCASTTMLTVSRCPKPGMMNSPNIRWSWG